MTGGEEGRAGVTKGGELAGQGQRARQQLSKMEKRMLYQLRGTGSWTCGHLFLSSEHIFLFQ
jgi:hypothetical protein